MKNCLTLFLMNKTLILFLIVLVTNQTTFAYTERNLLQNESTLEQLTNALIMNQKWVPFPDYTDRVGWDKYMGESKKDFIADGEKNLKYEWKVTNATVYLNYDRNALQTQAMPGYDQNINALIRLIMAELAEGKGRFMDQIINGVYLHCEMTSWGLAAHLANKQDNKRSLPNNEQHIIELVSSDVASIMAWAYYFFHNEFDKADPTISIRVASEIKKRILDVYVGFNLEDNPKKTVNNWNPWMNANVLQCFLLLENNKNKLAKAVYLTMQSVDQYINYQSDGACEEGPSYWAQGPAKLANYLELLGFATSNKVSIFDVPLIKNMGEYISRVYVGNGWCINFADAAPKLTPLPQSIYNFGKDVGSTEMLGFASYLYKTETSQQIVPSRYIIRTLLDLMPGQGLISIPPVHKLPPYTWYPQTEVCLMGKADNFLVGAKGGFNAESHNHNDAGSFILYSNTTPIIIDAGVDVYTKKTFSDERYTIWSMQSNYHNLPMINGVPQKEGADFEAKDTKFDVKKMTFSTNIAGAYPSQAEVKKWIRSYCLRENELIINDNFVLNKTVQPNQINFLTWGNVSLSTAGIVSIEVNNEKIELRYNSKIFTPTIETIDLKGTRLGKTWGDQIYRLSFTSKDNKISGKYTFTVKKNRR